jgi:hypothetical protein
VGVLLLAAAWVLTRCALLVLTREPGSYPFQDDPFDVQGFARWATAFTGDAGQIPLRDGPWEYPAGAALVVALPALLGMPYAVAFVAQMLLWDLAALALLAREGRRQGSWAGVWLWVSAVPLLGPVAVARFDVVPTVLAAAALVAASNAAPVAAGLLLSCGALVKGWPAALLPLVLAVRPSHPHRWVLRVLTGFLVPTALVLTAVAAAGGLGQVLSFLSYQRDRGLEVESLPALPLMVARARGADDVTVGFAFGSYEVDGPGAAVLEALATLGLLAVLAGVALLTLHARRARAHPADALPVLAVVLLSGVLVFDKVLSAQYPLWVAGLLALALCRPRSPLRRTVIPLVGLLLLTQYVYPLAIQDLLARRSAPVLALALRDALLLVVLAQAVVAARRLGGVRPSPSRPS